MSQKVFKTGNSLAVTIPANFARSVGIHPGDTVKTNAKAENGELVFTFSGAKQLALLEGFPVRKKLKHQNRSDDLIPNPPHQG